MATVQDPIDPTKAGHYPVILSDTLLGKGNKEAFTSIKYNYKPKPASENSQGDAIIQTSESSADSYNLNLTESNEEYAYHGSRQNGEGQYVLVFSPEQKAFILHKIDSTFNMNVASTPWDQDQDSLRTTYPQLGPTSSLPEVTKEKVDSKRGRKAEPKPKAQPRAQQKSQPKIPAKGLPKGHARAQPKKSKAAQREVTPDEEEESDDGLTIEYPDGPPRKSNNAAVSMMRSEPIHQDESEEEESGEEEERNNDVSTFKLPSPAGHQDAHEEDENDFDLDLEAELEQALKETEDGDGADESSESEEE